MIAPGASPGETKMWTAVRENGDFVTFVDHVKTNKHMFEFFSPSGSHTILVYTCRSYIDTKHRAASLRQRHSRASYAHVLDDATNSFVRTTILVSLLGLK